MKSTITRNAVLAILAVWTLGAVTHAAELGGAKLPDTLSAGDTTLKLNGLGLRKKAVFKVYVGGLYLPSHSSDAARFLPAISPKPSACSSCAT